MERFTTAVEAAVRSENYYGALLLTVTLPDIAGALMSPEEVHAGPRYKAWWSRYMLPFYTRSVGPFPDHVFLGSSDAWALRCALLHAGSDVIEGTRASEALDRFEFVQPPAGTIFHLNQGDRILYLQVDKFAAEVVAGVRHFSREFGAEDVGDKLVTITRTRALRL